MSAHLCEAMCESGGQRSPVSSFLVGLNALIINPELPIRFQCHIKERKQLTSLGLI